MKNRKTLCMSIEKHNPTLLFIGDEIVEIYFNCPKGAYKTELTFVASNNVHIEGSHRVKKNKDKLKEKYPELFENNRQSKQDAPYGEF